MRRTDVIARVTVPIGAAIAALMMAAPASGISSAGAGSDVAAATPARAAQLAITDFAKGLVFVTASGHRVASAHRPSISEFSISPDGGRIAYDAGLDAINVSPLSATRGTHLVGHAENPSWSPDGESVAYDGSNRSNHFEASIYTVKPGQTPVAVVADGNWNQAPSWSPDGVHIAYEQQTPSGGIGKRSGIYVTDGHTRSPVVLDQGPHNVNYDASWSPDGTRIAFISTRHGAKVDNRYEGDVYMVNADGTGLHRLTFDRRRDESTPVWSPDGRAIAYSVTLASRARTGVAVKPATGGSGCMIYSTWSGVDDLQWRPGYTSGPFRPAHCSRSLQPRRPAKPVLGCSRRAARNAVNRSKLSLRLKQIAHEPTRSGDFRFLCPDFTRDGRADLVVTFSAGVTGNTFRWAAFKRGGRDWHLVASKPGNYMRVSVKNHDILEQLPVVTYQNGFHFTGYHVFRYGWNGRRLALVSRGFHKVAAA